MSHKTVTSYINILHETGLIELIQSSQSGSNLLRQTEKILLDNPNLYQAIIEEIGYSSHIGSIREIFFIKMIRNAEKKIFYSHTADFVVDDMVFEIGGKSKTRKPLRDESKKAYLVKDDIVYGGKGEIPLYLFGFLY